MTESRSQVRLVDDAPADPDRPFLPGMGKQWLMPLYDPFTRIAGVARHRELLIELADVSSGQRVLDVGCGTGSLLVALARAVPGADLTGLDPDRDALRRAARKAIRAGIDVTLIRGYADRLPAADASLDHVVSTMALHHLDADTRKAFGAEARRALNPGGRITILDFGGGTHDGAHGPVRHLSGLIRRRPWNRPTPGADSDDGLPALLRAAGFADVTEIAHRDTAMGRLTYVQATQPSA